MRKTFPLLTVLCLSVLFLQAQPATPQPPLMAGPPPKTAAPTDSAAAGKQSLRPSEFMLAAGMAMVTSPVDLKNMYPSGQVYGLSAALPISKTFLFRIGVDFSNFNYASADMDKETDTIKVAGKTDTATLNHKSQMGLLGINLGLQWSPLPEGRLQPYIHAGGRFTSPTSSAGSLISVSRTDGEKYLIDKSYTRVTSFSLLAGAGLAFKLNKYIGINLEANYIADLTGNGTLTTTVKKYDDLNTQPSHVVAHDIAGINQLQVTGGIKFFLQ